MTRVLFWVCAVAASVFWAVALVMGGLEILQQVQGGDTEHTPRTLALLSLGPAVLLTAIAYAARPSDDSA